MSKTFCGVCGSSAESNGGTSGRGCYACFGAKKKEKAVSKRITTGMRIEAKRIGVKPTELGGLNLADARKIDRAIAAAVRKERERCVGIVVDELVETHPYAVKSIREKINAKAIRKGKA